MKRASFLISLLVGVTFIVYSAIPSVYAYPYSDGPNSGPTNM